MSLYIVLKHVHIFSVTLSLWLFLWRWQGPNSAWRTQRFWRWAPHVNDTILLLSALALVGLWGGLYPWMFSKIGALIVYILLGRQALRQRGRASLFYGCAALAVFAFIISVALSKSPWGLLALRWPT